GRVEVEPVVHLGAADVLAPAYVLRLLDLDTGVTTPRRAGQAPGLGEVLRPLALGLQVDDLLRGQRGDALGTLVGVGHRDDAEDVGPDVPGVARDRHRTLTAEVLVVGVGVLVVAEGRLDDDPLAVDLDRKSTRLNS